MERTILVDTTPAALKAPLDRDELIHRARVFEKLWAAQARYSEVIRLCSSILEQCGASWEDISLALSDVRALPGVTDEEAYIGELDVYFRNHRDSEKVGPYQTPRNLSTLSQ